MEIAKHAQPLPTFEPWTVGAFPSGACTGGRPSCGTVDLSAPHALRNIIAIINGTTAVRLSKFIFSYPFLSSHSYRLAETTGHSIDKDCRIPLGKEMRKADAGTSEFASALPKYGWS